MSHERRLEIPAISVSSFLQSDKRTTSDFTTELRLGLGAFKAAFQYTKVSGDETALIKAAKNYTSAFDAGMPGLITLNELCAKEDFLGRWKIRLRGVTASLEVKSMAK